MGTRLTAGLLLWTGGALHTLAAAGIDPWQHQHTLYGGVPQEAPGNDLLGQAVAISGSVLVAGAFSDDIELAGGPAGNVGSVYVWHHDGEQWTLQQRLIAPDAEANAWFGIDVAVDGDTLVVGARLHDSPAAGGGAPETDQGAVYVYRELQGVWTLEQILTPALPLGANAQFGWAVALQGDTLAIGAPDAGEGIVDVYLRGTGASPWQLQQRLSRPTGSGFAGPNAFGRALAVEQDQLLIGAPLEDNPPFTHGDAGAAYVYQRVAGTWTLHSRLQPTVPVVGAAFGSAVALRGEHALIGSPDEPVNGLGGAGVVDRLWRSAGVWSVMERWQDTAPASSARFGQAVALGVDEAVVGAYWAAGSAGAQEGKLQIHAGSGMAPWPATQTLQSPPATRAAFNQFATDVALERDWLVAGEPGLDRLSNNDGAVQVYQRTSPPIFADGFEAARCGTCQRQPDTRRCFFYITTSGSSVSTSGGTERSAPGVWSN